MQTLNLINFIDLTLKEKEMVLKWRNHPKIKRWMHNSNDITLENHLAFIDSLKNCSDKFYFLLKQEDNYLGVIDFTNILSKTSEFGLYANIELKGVGNNLLDSVCNYGFNILQLDILRAEVYEENEKAIKLYKKFYFKETNKKTINNKVVICMELKNENR